MRKYSKRLYVTTVLIAANVLVYLWLSFLGDTENTQFLLEHGAMNTSLVMQGEWWRIFTHMFMHAGVYHLFSNMIMLAAIGFELEEVLGGIKYSIVYFVGGLGATAFSSWYEITNNMNFVDVGASGAVMAVFAAFTVVIIKNRKDYDKTVAIRMILVLALMVFGNMGPEVNWMAHLGGAVTGLILGVILYWPKKRQSYQ